MERNVDINVISDGKKYKSSDMAKIGCNDCSGCSKCCHHMDGLITLDPYDIYRLICGSNGEDFTSIQNNHIDYIVDKGIITPTLKMSKESGACTFLNDNGRCSVHDARPGICRLFPLGRLYEDGSFSYFLQKDECDYKEKSKVKIKNWIATKELAKYEKYISDWHYFIKEIKDYLETASEDEVKQINSALLQIFFITPYSDDFYGDFYSRLDKVKQIIETYH
ncbi:MAG: YkgJ family cysteine cluster protein [Lachnospiraceae bacterium]|nr:YkgJ family cysteine cluster protein [Lachnospiraceae bacterium]